VTVRAQLAKLSLARIELEALPIGFMTLLSTQHHRKYTQERHKVVETS
jgi:hypothetical protein